MINNYLDQRKSLFECYHADNEVRNEEPNRSMQRKRCGQDLRVIKILVCCSKEGYLLKAAIYFPAMNLKVQLRRLMRSRVKCWKVRTLVEHHA